MKHTLSVLVEDESGALSRIAGVFARRGFNIESLAVGPAEKRGHSRLTLLHPPPLDCVHPPGPRYGAGGGGGGGGGGGLDPPLWHP